MLSLPHDQTTQHRIETYGVMTDDGSTAVSPLELHPGATATGETLLEQDELQHPWTLANHHRTKHRIATGREEKKRERCGSE